MSTALRPQIPAIDLLKRGWELTQPNLLPLAAAVLLVAAISTVASAISGGIGGFLVQGPLAYGLFALSRNASLGRPVEFQQLFDGFQRFVPTFVAGLLIGLFESIAGVVGLMLCLFPAIIFVPLVAMLYSLTYLYMLEEGLDAWPAMEKSRLTVMANLGQWVVFSLLLAVVNFIGAIPCGLGLLITVPVTTVALTLAFDLECGSHNAPPTLPPGALDKATPPLGDA